MSCCAINEYRQDRIRAGVLDGLLGSSSTSNGIVTYIHIHIHISHIVVNTTAFGTTNLTLRASDYL